MTETPLTLPFLEVPQSFSSNLDYLTWEINRLRLWVESWDEMHEGGEALRTAEEFVLLGRATRDAIRAARRRSEEEGVQLAIEDLIRRVQLDAEHEEILLLLICAACCEPLRQKLLALQGDGLVRAGELELGFVSELLHPTLGRRPSQIEWSQPNAALRQHGLIHLEAPGGGVSGPGGLLRHSVRAAQFIIQAVQGKAVVDHRLQPFCAFGMQRIGLESVVLNPNVLSQVNAFISAFRQKTTTPRLNQLNWTLLIAGDRRCGKTLLARGLATAFKRPLYELDVEALSRRHDAPELIAIAVHNAAYFQSIFHIQRPEFALPASPVFGALLAAIGGYPGLVILEPHEPQAMDKAFEHVVTHTLSLGRLDVDEREAIWELHVPDEIELAEDVRLRDVASAYELSGGQIARAMSWAEQQARGRGSQTLQQTDLVRGATHQLFSRIGQFADRRRVKASLDDLILPPEVSAEVHRLLNACRCRVRVMNDWGFGSRLVSGKGLVALLAGEPGTGKTLTAEILANEMGMQLDIVSIPKIVSKWVGETEKNIQQIFAEARASDTILLFDEADSLFAKRVKVERASDHFQNMEVNM
ncbi:MAG: AAA family ATPase, partial [Myxococcota bacterium]|nr:AAA family ATPase [Myxococcota bacterium]